MRSAPISIDNTDEVAIHWVMRQAEGPLTADEVEVFVAWLADNPVHEEAFADAVEAWNLLDGRSLEAEVVQMRTQALDALAVANQRRWRTRRPGWPMAAAAAVLGLAVLGGYAWSLRPDHYETGLGERRLVTLADGSRLTMDAQTSVDVSYGAHDRSFTLDHGRATFEVARDPLRPFSVTNRGNVVVATGTQFSVEQLGGETRVVLYEGHVAILQRHGGEGALSAGLVGLGRGGTMPAEQALTPGRELVMTREGALSSVHDVEDVGAQRAWEQGQVDLANERLAVAAERMNRYARSAPLVVESSAADIRVSGLFNAGDNNAFVAGVTGVFPVEAHVAGDGSIHLSKKM